MFLEEELKKIGDKNIRIYLDMDGTIVHYDVGVADNYHLKRPLTNRIKSINNIMDNYKNVTFYILSIGHEQKHIDQKNEWLDKYLPRILKENRIILIRNPHGQVTSAIIKKNYINNIKTNDVIILIDDDPRTLGALKNENKNNTILFKDSILSD